ncbi:MAG: putative DNA binding domain-containing protein [Propionibacteriaceae bacterium]|jgi:ATP-dependent DNA helicase RecG|nr:putative DNA binding domain-containing protein [Propionibacteriaceae bacterium]
MTEQDLLDLLDRLIGGWENEIVEFKETGNDYSTGRIGEYFSALSNEANLRGAEAGWLIFGVNDKTRQVVGTGYRPQSERLQSLKAQIAQDTEPSVTFRTIREVTHAGGRVVMMEVPPAPDGIPISWKGHYYARAGESLAPLGLDKLDRIRRQGLNRDWSAVIVPEATADDFDPEALEQARRAFTHRHQHRFTEEEVLGWPVTVFTDRAKLTANGQVTRAALLLIGKAESAWRLSPHPAQLTWSLVEPNRAYEHFGPPFLLTTHWLYRRIRNVQLRLMRPGTLRPVEVSQYDERMVLEALHNAVAHQAYARSGRVLVQEFANRLVLTSEGGFFDGLPQEYAPGGKSATRYRNAALAQAMVELGMIDTLSYGIFDMHDRQKRRYLPMPDYDLADPNQVKLTIHGSVVDEAYTNLLMSRTDLPLTDVLALDRVQKGLPIPEDAVKRLRRQALIEGRRPHLRVVPTIADATATEAGHIHARGQDDLHYLRLIVDHLTRFGTATRQDIDDLLLDKLGDTLTAEQKTRKIANLLTKLRRDGHIYNSGSRTNPVWTLADRPD